MDFGNIKRSKIKEIILKEKLFEYKCNECNSVEWRGKKLSLHLDHINGINNDNRLENLRFLCPNCHSQTDTYCGKSNKTAGHYSTKNFKVSDEELLESMRNSSSISETLTNVGLSGANNYNRVKKLAIKHNIGNVLKFVEKQNINKFKIALLKEANIDFTKYGWVQEASKILEITPQKTRKFIERNAPDLLINANRRNNSFMAPSSMG